MKQCLTVFFLMSALNLFAQPSKGDIILSGSLNYGTQTVDFNDTQFENNLLVFRPNLGYSVTDNIEVGFVGFYTSQLNRQDDDEIKNTSASTGLYGRYKLPLSENKKLLVFGELAVPRIVNSNNFTTELDLFELNFSPGLTYYFTKRFAAEVNAGGVEYLNQKNPVDDSVSNTFEITIFNDAFVGFRWNAISTKKK